MTASVRFFSLLLISFIFLRCNTNKALQSTVAQPGLFKVAILYPNGKDKVFDMEYYEKAHMPMMAGFLGKNLKFYEIDKGIAGRTANDDIPFVAIGYFYCYNVTDYNKAVAKNIEAILADIKKYTNIQPTVQISEIRQIRYNTAK